MYLGQNEQLLVATPADRAMTVLDASAMQAVSPPAEGECPPCDPQIIYKTKIVEKEVPGPTQIVYRDRTTTQPAPSPPSGGMAPAPTDEEVRDWYISHGLEVPPALLAPEESEMSEGGVEARTVGGKMPWGWLLLGAGAVMLMAKKK